MEVQVPLFEINGVQYTVPKYIEKLAEVLPGPYIAYKYESDPNWRTDGKGDGHTGANHPATQIHGKWKSLNAPSANNQVMRRLYDVKSTMRQRIEIVHPPNEAFVQKLVDKGVVTVPDYAKNSNLTIYSKYAVCALCAYMNDKPLDAMIIPESYFYKVSVSSEGVITTDYPIEDKDKAAYRSKHRSLF